ncbi:MAG: hypothetical protein KDA74_01335 [Planctomycetaceae bacterium]|nr:hypothetical protein [Planctomycetaceae bacterium]
MKYLIAFAAVAVLIATGISAHPPRGNQDRDCQRPDGPPPDPFMKLFDTDQSGEISKEEIEQSGVVLKNLDRDQSGTLTRDEMPRPPHPPRDHHGRGEGDRHPHHGDRPHRDRDHRPDADRPPRPGFEPMPEPAPQKAVSTNTPADTVQFAGGYETDPRDHGRPVALIAAALGVKPEVFRQAFSNVKPARGGDPTPARARANKEVLMAALGKHGITNDRLDTVSNYYRYQPERGGLWKHTPATAKAIIKDGKVTGMKIINAGSGYLTHPTVTIAGHEEVKVQVTLEFSQDFKKNGSIKSLKIMN